MMEPGVQSPDSGDELTAEQSGQAVSLILGFCALNQACKLYEINNSLVGKILEEMQGKVRTLTSLGEGVVSITSAGHSFFLNRHLVRIGFSEYKKARQLKDIWGKIGVGEVSFPVDVTLEGLQEFATQFVAALKDPAQATALLSREWGGVRARAVLGGDDRNEDAPKESYELGVRVYCGLVMLVRETLDQFDKDSWSTMLQIKRTLQVMVEKLEADRDLLAALTVCPTMVHDLSRHLVNTALLSLMLGRGFDMRRRDLVSLATAALFHDLPKRGLNDRTLNSLEKPAKVPAKDRARIDMHWLKVLRQMVKTGGFQDETLVRLVVAYESQLEFARGDLYPAATVEKSMQTLFTSMVALCDRFDTLIWPRQGKRGTTPHRAMLSVAASAGKRFDPGLVRMFVDRVGLYPVGSAVQLSDGAAAVVTSLNPGGDGARPQVMVVVDGAGQPADGPRLNLADEGSPTIARDLDARMIDVNTIGCFG